MKKSLFATFLVLVLLVTGLAVSVQAATVPAGAEVIEIGSDAAWKEWFDGGGSSKLMTQLNSTGKAVHIKITRDFTISGAEKTSYLSYGSNTGDVYLDLNGHTLTYANTEYRWFGIYNPNTTVKIFNGKMVNKAAAGASNGVFCIMTQGNLILEDLIYRDDTTHTYTQSSKMIRIAAPASVTMNNVDVQINTQNNTKSGIISCSGTLNINNSTIAVSETGKAVQGGMIYLDGGTTTINNSTLYGGMAQTGGMIYMTGKATKLIINSGTIAGGTATGNGGNIYMVDGANLQIKDGVIKDGTAANGGNIYAAVIGTDTGTAYQTDIEMTGGTVTGGLALEKTDASGGGNIALVGIADNTTQPKLTISAGTIGGAMLTPGRDAGKAYIGGNIYAIYGVLEVSGKAEISGGKADYQGGNIGYCRGTFNFSGGTISGGVSGDLGGNICLTGTATKVTISGGNILGGYATTKGGNIYIAARSMPVNITGGTIADGEAFGNGGNICASNGKLTITGGTITGGKSGQGGNLYIQSTGSSCLTTIGNCTIVNGKARNLGDDIFVSEQGKLKIKKDFAGTAYVSVADAHLPTTVGGNLAEKQVLCEGPFSGKLYLQNLNGQPQLYGLSDQKVYVSCAAIANKDGSVQWFKNNTEMMAAVNADTAYLMPAAGNVALSGGTYTADLQGNNVNFTGSGQITCFDSANADYKTNGVATFNGVTLANDDAETINGATYCTLAEDGGYSFHRLDMKITAVSLRTRTAGIYYWADWDCDEILAKQISSYGIACRLDGMPTSGNLWEEKKTQRSVLYALDGTDIFANPKENDEVTGAIINNILFADARTDANGKPVSNDTYGKTPIYAAPYVTLKNGTAVVARQNVGYSLYDLVQQIDRQKNAYAVYAKQLQQFFAQWEPYGINWALDFDVSEDIIHLESLYDGRTAYHGELHDHSNTGGTSDGRYTLKEWAAGMEKLGMDYAALLDHRQSLHMYLPDWDDSIFVGGTEAAGSVTDRPAAYNFFHYNMIFATPQQLENVLHAFPEYEFKEQTEGEHIGEWHFKYVPFTAARFNELISKVKAEGGFFAIPHPSVTEAQFTLEDIEVYWFQDETGWEVFYGNDTPHNDTYITRQNYAMWIALLQAGKRVWATSGNDDHEMPATTCLNTIYSTEGKAQAHIDQLRVGNFTAGPVGIKMCIGDTQMGGQCDFNGQRLVFGIGDIHESAQGHTYTVKLLKNEEVISTWTIDGVEDFYYATDVDADAEYYRIEVYNNTYDRLIALGNPIWNLD